MYFEMLALLVLLILVHEAGHLVAARLGGIAIAEFSVGLGPILRRLRWRGTDFVLRVLPLGGFVQPSDAEGLAGFPLGKRVLFYAGGPVLNLLVALVLFGVLVVRDGATAFQRLTTASSSPALQGVVGVFADGSQALEAGFGLEVAIGLSFSLALLNLLPVPLLDGGQLLLAVLEECWPALRSRRPALSFAGAGFLAVGTVALAIADSLRLGQV